MSDLDLKQYEKLGPFEIKDFLAKVATKSALEASSSYLNAGRGNPNWVATEPREAFFLLGQFAITECKRVLDLPPGVGGMPKEAGCAARLEAWVTKHEDMPGASFLKAMVPWAVKKFSFNADKFVHELVDSIIGDHYPVPDRMLVHNEQIVHEYLEWAMCGEPSAERQIQDLRGRGRHRLRCATFLHNRSRATASSTPATPRSRWACRSSRLHPRDGSTWKITTSASSSRSKAPQEEQVPAHQGRVEGNSSTRRSRRSSSSIPATHTPWLLSRKRRSRTSAISSRSGPDLILLTDDVYGTFVPGFRSLMGAFPKNTIGVYSYSKYFGCTGWRLGTIAVHEDNIFDEMIAKQPDAIQKKLDKRYGGLSLEPRKIKFIDRIVADSRDVALNHTAGLSLPQQVMMSLFSLSELMDTKKDYQKACIGIVKKRVEATIEGLGIEVGENPLFDYYYGLIDFEFFARKHLGEDIVKWMKANVHPLDIVFRLAEDHGIVLLNGSGFAAPDWSVRISFANLDDHVYDDIGRALRAIARGYRQAYEAAGGKTAQPAGGKAHMATATIKHQSLGRVRYGDGSRSPRHAVGAFTKGDTSCDMS